MQVLKLPGLADPIAAESIICVKGYINYSWLHYTARPKSLAAKTLKWVEAQLPGFIRIHHSSLINPTHITQVQVNGTHTMSVRMTNGLTLAVARRRIKQVCHQLGELA